MPKLVPASSMPILFFLFFFVSITSYAQTNNEREQLKQINYRLMALSDSAANNAERKRLLAEYREIIKQSPSYSASGLFYEVSRADIDALNKDLLANGMKELSDVFHGIGFGLNRKNNKVPTHFLITAGLGNKSSNADHYVRLSTFSLSLDKGYAIIDSKNVVFHPFVGVGMQIHTIKVREKHTATPVNGLFDIAQGDVSGTISQDTYYPVLGAQFSYNGIYGESYNVGVQLAVRFAYNPVLIKGKYLFRNDASNYKPDIAPRQFNVTVMVNILHRTAFHLRPFLGGE